MFGDIPHPSPPPSNTHTPHPHPPGKEELVLVKNAPNTVIMRGTAILFLHHKKQILHGKKAACSFFVLQNVQCE